VKVLVYGAGVIGCIYAARLRQSGCAVTLLARGAHFKRLDEHGIVIRNILTGKRTMIKVPLTSALSGSDQYDLIIVTVRLDQLGSVLPALRDNPLCPLVMFMLNNPDELSDWGKEIGQKHIILGFPGVGGSLENESIDYLAIKQQPTSIGKSAGKTSKDTYAIKMLLEEAGFPVTIRSNMPAWLKVHALFIACATAAIMRESGNSVQLGKNKSSISMMVKSIREGFGACRSLGIPIIPLNLKIIFEWMPHWFSVWYWQKAMQGETGRLAIAPHANKAKGEMQALAEKVLQIVHSSAVSTPTLDRLLTTFIS
jgi:2-dehydropantoate 2-reductase